MSPARALTGGTRKCHGSSHLRLAGDPTERFVLPNAHLSVSSHAETRKIVFLFFRTERNKLKFSVDAQRGTKLFQHSLYVIFVPADLHVLLLEDLIILLQRQDDKLVLKCLSTTFSAGYQDVKVTPCD